MNTAQLNAPAIVISVLILLAALLIGALFHDSGLFLAYVIPGVLLLLAALTPISLLMTKQWEKAVVLRFGKLKGIRGRDCFSSFPSWIASLHGSINASKRSNSMLSKRSPKILSRRIST